jgi:hypothetical protein
MVPRRQRTSRPHRIVDQQVQAPVRFERERDDVDVFVGEKATDVGERAGTVGEAEGEFRANHEEFKDLRI